MINKDQILFYLRKTLKQVTVSSYPFASISEKEEIEALADAIVFIESTYPENQSRETD